jgi:hypothetical protein
MSFGCQLIRIMAGSAAVVETRILSLDLKALADRSKMDESEMPVDDIEYQGHRLRIVAQRGGGYLVEITPLAGGPTIRTQTYQSTQEAIANAKTTIAKHPGKR